MEPILFGVLVAAFYVVAFGLATWAIRSLMTTAHYNRRQVHSTQRAAGWIEAFIVSALILVNVIFMEV